MLHLAYLYAHFVKVQSLCKFFRKPRVLKFELADNTVRERLKGQSTAQIEQDLKDYHREMDYVASYFPQADIVKIDGSKKEQAIFDQIHKAIDEYLKKP